MAMPAAQSIHQRYRAGDCTLDLTLQPSSLSQWYPQPIVDRVQFQLWMRDGQRSEEGAPVLLAEGDRTDLQMIARYVEYRTRAVLALPRSRQSVEKSEPPLPLGCHLPDPMSYLHLCDLSSVLGQYEQATAPLPVELDIVPERTQQTANVVPLPVGQAANALPRKKARRSRFRLPFRSGRNIWVSSAAAALFAVGLTTLVWNRSSVPTATSVAEAERAEPGFADASPDRLTLDKGENSELSAALPRDSSENPTPSSAAESARSSGSPRQLRNRSTAGNNRSTSVPSDGAIAPPVTPEESAADEPAPAQVNPDEQLGQTESRSEIASSAAESDTVVSVPAPTAARPSARTTGSALDRAIAQAESDADRSNADESAAELAISLRLSV